MTILSFDMFKDKLLDGSKKQTIRTPTDIKVGTPLQIYWKYGEKKKFECTSKYPYGKPCRYYYETPSCREVELICRWQIQVDGSEKLFDTVCTETFLIEIGKIKRAGISDKIPYIRFVDEIRRNTVDEISKLDGFEDIKIAKDF